MTIGTRRNTTAEEASSQHGPSSTPSWCSINIPHHHAQHHPARLQKTDPRRGLSPSQQRLAAWGRLAGSGDRGSGNGQHGANCALLRPRAY